MKINWQAAKSCGINFGMASGRATLCPSRRATEIFGAETARDIVTGRDDMQTGRQAYEATALITAVAI